MNNAALRPILVIAEILVLVVVWASVFIVQQTQYALVLRFGAVQASIQDPGLHVKLPLIDTVLYFDKRVLDLDLPVRPFCPPTDRTWRSMPSPDTRSRIPSSSTRPWERSLSPISGCPASPTRSMRNVLASASRDAIVRTDRGGLMNRIQEDVNRQAQSLGIEMIDVRLTRVDLPAANSQAVYQRMRTEREREAADLRANGQQRAQTIRARAEREATVIRADANRQAEESARPGRCGQEPHPGRGLRPGSGLLRLLPLDAGLRSGTEIRRYPARAEPDLRLLPVFQRSFGPGKRPGQRGAGPAGSRAGKPADPCLI